MQVSPNRVYTTEVHFGLCRGRGRQRLAAYSGKLFTAASPCSFHLMSEPPLLKGHVQGGPGKHPYTTSPSTRVVLLFLTPKEKFSSLWSQPQNCIPQTARTEAKGKVSIQLLGPSINKQLKSSKSSGIQGRLSISFKDKT